jgi:hypothetical protein
MDETRLQRSLAEGQKALGEGRWRDARARFEESLAIASVPAAFEGLVPGCNSVSAW